MVSMTFHFNGLFHSFFNRGQYSWRKLNRNVTSRAWYVIFNILWKLSTHIPNHNLQLPLIQNLTLATFVRNCGAKPNRSSLGFNFPYPHHDPVKDKENLSRGHGEDRDSWTRGMTC